MKSEDESIKMLEMRMQQQVNISREKQMTPQNIQYFISSAALHREAPLPNIPSARETISGQAVPENIQAARKPAAEETKNLQRENVALRKNAPSLETKYENDRQKLWNYGIREALQKIKASENTETQQIKGQNEYKKILRAMNGEDFSEVEMSLFNGKI